MMIYAYVVMIRCEHLTISTHQESVFQSIDNQYLKTAMMRFDEN